jgi:hypothetical protein
MQAEHIQPASPNENGDVEQSHNRFLTRIDQALMLRGSRSFASRAEYQEFLRHHCDKANRNRSARFNEEHATLRALPPQSYDAAKRIKVRVSAGSTIRVVDNVYSVPSRLIGEQVAAIVHSESIDVVYAQRVLLRMARLRGKGGHCIDYRHIIDWLVKKPGAFDQYIYQTALFPTSRFRIAYDVLVQARMDRGKKEYLLILQLAAQHGQDGVEDALRSLLESGRPVTKDAVLTMISQEHQLVDLRDVHIPQVDLTAYDLLIATHGIQVRGEAIYV